MKKGEDFRTPFALIRERFLDLSRELKTSGTMSSLLDEIEEKIAAGASADYAASRGEYLSARMIAEFLGYEFIDAGEVIKLTEDGRVDESTYELVPARLKEGCRYVIPGFYGVTLKGIIKTFSRGGSDITGAIAARAAGASLYENWTDVSGILTADPRIVDSPKPVTEITYREIREMATVGANVFHEEAIAPVKSAGIPINIRNTNLPDEPGTMILPGRDASRVAVVGVAGKEPYRKITLEKFMLSRYPDLPSLARKQLKELGFEPEFELRGVDTLTFFASGESFLPVENLEIKLAAVLEADKVSFGPLTAVIGVVGEGLSLNPVIPGRLTAALGEAGIPPEGINYGGSSIMMMFAVPQEHYGTAVNLLNGVIVSL